MTGTPSVAFLPIGQVVGTTVLARWRGQLRVTVITKATFAFVQNGELELVNPAPLAKADEHFGNTPLRSVRVASDMAPHLSRVDVLFAGHAHAPSGAPVQRMTVRLGLANDSGPLIDKRLDIIGERKRNAKGEVSEPEPFKKMPLIYERAIGGAPSAENPLGVGLEGAGLLPSVLHSENGRAAMPASFAPISANWEPRKALLGGFEQKRLKQPIAELPDDFAWAYFQAAPADQQIRALRGREWIVLEGVNAKHPNLYMRLPAVRAGACLYSPRALPQIIGLEPDMLFLDGEAERATITFRASFPIENEASLEGSSVASGIELPGSPLTWPAPPDAPAAPPIPEVKAAPFAEVSETFVFPDFEVIQSKGLPFAAPPPVEKATAVAAPLPAQAKQTFVLPDDVVIEAAMPFASMPSTTPERARDAAPIPGAPWGSTARAPLPASYKSTLYLDDILAPLNPFVSPPVATPSAPAPRPATPDAPPKSFPPRAPLPNRDEVEVPRSGVVPARAPISIPFLFQTPLVAFTVPWQVRPRRDSITVVVKGTFDLVHGAPATLRSESDPPNGDVNADGRPESSLLRSTDFAILKPRADVTLTGHAYAQSGSAATGHVRFRVGRGDGGFDRRLAVIGDRFWQSGSSGGPPSAPLSFDKIPLVYERAYGGPGFGKNPSGRGRTPAADGRIPLPNLEEASALVRSVSDAPLPICFCAIPPAWPARCSKLGTYDEAWQRERWPYFPDDFDWSFFQSAPPEQQLEHLEGDEPYLLAGVRPNQSVIEGELPRIRVRCFAQRTTEAGGEFFEVKLRLDTAAFDADRMTLNLVWRGLFEVRDDEASEIAELFVMSEAMGKPAATLDEAREKLFAIKAPREEMPDVVGAAIAPANDPPPPAPGVDTPDELDSEMDGLERKIRERLASSGVVLPNPEEAPPPRPRRSPAEMLDAMRAAGMPAAEIAALAEAIAPEAEEERPAENPVAPLDRGLLRVKAIAMLDAGASFDDEDFAGADLSGLDFTGRSLARVNLKESNLIGCSFEGANLSGAELGGADLTDASLDGANLADADFVMAILRRARLKTAAVARADFSDAIGEDANLEGAQGENARFAGGNWTRATFAGADLANVDFSRAILDETLFDAAVMREIRLYDVRGAKASFAKAQMAGARADGAALLKCSFAHADATSSTWEKATLDESSFLGAAFAGSGFARTSCLKAVFSGADVSGGRFDRAKLAGASLLKANLMKASLEAADLSGADFRGANLHGAELWKAKLGGARFEGAILTKTKLGATG